MLTREFNRQIINLLQEGQITLAAIHAHQNKSVELDESLLRKYIPESVLSEFNELTGELNGGTTL